MEQQREDAAGVIEQHYREMLELQKAVEDAKIALRAGAAERGLRQRVEKLRAVIHRIDCEFTTTGHTGSGPGKKNSRFVTITVHPVSGDSARYSVDSGKAL